MQGNEEKGNNFAFLSILPLVPISKRMMIKKLLLKIRYSIVIYKIFYISGVELIFEI